MLFYKRKSPIPQNNKGNNVPIIIFSDNPIMILPSNSHLCKFYEYISHRQKYMISNLYYKDTSQGYHQSMLQTKELYNSLV